MRVSTGRHDGLFGATCTRNDVGGNAAQDCCGGDHGQWGKPAGCHLGCSSVSR